MKYNSINIVFKTDGKELSTNISYSSFIDKIGKNNYKVINKLAKLSGIKTAYRGEVSYFENEKMVFNCSFGTIDPKSGLFIV